MMARHKDTAWNLPEGKKQPDGSSTHSWESINASLLMDIRDELKRMNALLHCSNFVNIPTTLRSIRRAMPARKKVRK